MKQFLFSLSLIVFLGIGIGYAQQPGHKTYIAEQTGKNFFPLVADGKAAPVYTGTDEYPGAMRAVKSLIGDIKSVTTIAPGLITDIRGEKQIVLIGTLGKNAAIDELVKLKKLNVNGIAGKWETYLIQVVPKPFPGVESALVIAGSDKRGTIYGAYDVSAQIGVSPWYWWADVPVKTKKELYVMPGRYTDGQPTVKYRGIFIMMRHRRFLAGHMKSLAALTTRCMRRCLS